MMSDHEAAVKLEEKLKDVDIRMGCNDPEGKHVVADAFLCELLTELGFTETVEVYNSFTKWCG